MTVRDDRAAVSGPCRRAPRAGARLPARHRRPPRPRQRSELARGHRRTGDELARRRGLERRRESARGTAGGRGPPLRYRPSLPRDRRCARVLGGRSPATRPRRTSQSPHGHRAGGKGGSEMTSPTESQVREALRAGTAAHGGEGGEKLGAWLAERAERERLLDVAYAPLDTPLGEATVAATERGLVRVVLPTSDRDQALEQLAREISRRILEAPARVDRARRELDEYFAGRRRAFDLDV